ncbi:MAG: MFS transporter [Fimbriimonas sp.]
MPDHAHDPYATLRIPELRRLILGTAFASLANGGLAVIVGLQVWDITKNPLMLGLLGLVEAIPALSLVLFGGHVADRNDRRRLVLVCEAVAILCALAFAAVSFAERRPRVEWLYGIVFFAGIARGFANPAAAAFEGQVIPRELYVNAGAWSSSVSQTCAVVGPTLAGFAYASWGPAGSYLGIAALLAGSWTCIYGIAPRPVPEWEAHESVWESIAVGIRFVRKSQPLMGSMALDLFAVFFGGAIALLPVFADQILHVGPQALGFMRGAPAVGALAVMLWATRNPPVRHAGRNLLLCVAGFGVSMIAFGLSRNLWFSVLALVASGGFDGISMVIRGAILRLLTPENLRGRVSAVNWVFIGSSNELGALESGLAAKWLGATRAVWAGGIVCLGVVAACAALLPELRHLHLDPKQALKEDWD